MLRQPWDPVDAHVDLTAHQRIVDVPGIALDVSGTMQSVMQGLFAGHDTYLVCTRKVPANLTVADSGDVDVTNSPFARRIVSKPWLQSGRDITQAEGDEGLLGGVDGGVGRWQPSREVLLRFRVPSDSGGLLGLARL